MNRPNTERPLDPARRGFLAQLGGTTAGIIAGGGLAGLGGLSISPARAWAHAAGSDTLKVALIGCGGRGTGAAVQAVTADKGAVLWAMADAFPDRMTSSLGHITKELADRKDGSEKQVQVTPERQFAGIDGYKKAIAECDVVLLTATPHFRPMHLREAVTANKHVFCEKPVAVDSTGCRSVLESVEMARAKKLSLVCGFCWRYHTRERDIYTRINDGAIGAIRSMTTNYNSNGWVESKKRKAEWSDLEFQMRNWQYFTWLSGDHIVEQAIHAINKIAWAFGEQMPAECIAVGGRQVRENVPETGNVFDHFGVEYRYSGGKADGARAFHMARHWPNSSSENADFIMGEKGFARVNGWNGVHQYQTAGSPVWNSEAQANDMYQQEHDELFASIRAGKPMNDGVMMTNSTLMAIMARMAAYTGQTVTWKQVMESKEDFSLPAYGWDVSLPADRSAIAKPGTTKLL
jgi:myo-inositol 2-dehydrogenase/D-chiro-inositol 1-dehydrogenase